MDNPAVNVWTFSLKATESKLLEFNKVIVRAEQARAARFATARLRERYIVCRATVRLILAKLLHRSPSDVELAADENGKPYIANLPRACNLKYNLSHSRDFAALATATDQEVGVDIEQLRPLSHLDRLIGRCLTGSEQTALRDATEQDRLIAFFRLWTHKEAYSKLVGLGLRIPMSRIEFELVDGVPVRLIRWPPMCEPLPVPAVMTLNAHAECCGALAVSQRRKAPVHVHVHDWSH